MLDARVSRFADTAMVRAVAFQKILSLAAFQGAKAKLDAALAVTLPECPIFMVKEAVTYMWSGPDSWLVFGMDMPGLAVAKPYAAITDQSDGRVVFEISGPAVKSVLSKIVPVDLHDEVFPVGGTALTLAGHINVQIWRVSEDRYGLACFRSFANALYAMLTTSCREFES